MQQKLLNVFNSNDFSENEISRIKDNLKLSHSTRCFNNYCAIWYVCYLKANCKDPIPVKAFSLLIEKETSIPWTRTYSRVYMGKRRLKDKTIQELLSDPQYNITLEEILEETKDLSGEGVQNVS